MLHDQNSGAAGAPRVVDPESSVEGLGVLRISVGHHDVGILEGGRAVGFGRHADAGVVRVHDVAAPNPRRPQPIVI
jgi:hypothetical protein